MHCERIKARRNLRILILAVWTFCLVALGSAPAMAYIGPGVGISMLGALWAVIATIVVALIGIVLWPLRAMLKRRRGEKGLDEQRNQSGGQDVR